ncbi:MAG: undecaprenyl/decaprenyl-phosphate alpha-N-acetylglucosaminyl 1-phosphate transferase [Rhizobium sp.]|nr:undecaprenyl/decaprenyl-phosphate alpha-N-acetylglucosaminyl 1-phosphate transferase [Rhizobium sp.]
MDLLELVNQLTPASWLRAALAFAIVAALVPLGLPLARRWNWVDRPGGRKQHDGAVPVIGGIAILLASMVTFLVFEPQFNLRVFTFFLGATLLVAVGQLDDLHDLRARCRIGAQVLAALSMIFLAGWQATNLQDVFGFAASNIGLLAVPFTVFIVVGVINALNMADGVDGLAGSLALVSMLLFTCFALYAGDAVLAERLLGLSAALLGFLLWNHRFPWQPRAKVFLGNGGSMLLGFIIAWSSVRLTQNPTHPVSPVLGPWTLALPLIDCVVLMVRRWRHGVSPFKADRNHMHHLLLDAGYTPTMVVMVMAGGSLLLGLGAAVAVKLGVYRPLLVLVFLVLLMAWYVFSRKREPAVARLRWLRGGRPSPQEAPQAGEATETR